MGTVSQCAKKSVRYLLKGSTAAVLPESDSQNTTYSLATPRLKLKPTESVLFKPVQRPREGGSSPAASLLVALRLLVSAMYARAPQHTEVARSQRRVPCW